MKKQAKLTILGVLGTLILIPTLDAIAEEATAGQDVSMSIDQVLLLDVDNTVSPELVGVAPTVAGQTFESWTINNGSSNVLLSSNVSTAKIYVQSDFDFSAQNVSLGVLFSKTGGSTSNTSLTDTSEKLLGDIGNISTGIIRTASPLSINYTATKFNNSSTQMPASGSYSATITYTVKAN